MKQGTLLLWVVLFVHSTVTIAADEARFTRSVDDITAAKLNDAWFGSVGFGAILSRGNTETTNVIANATAKLDQETWRHKIEAAALNTDSNGNTTAERYLLGYKIDYKLNAKSYLFSALRAEFDKFSGYDQQLSAAIGYGFRAIDSTSDSLDLEIGAGVRQNKLANGETESEAIARAALDYQHYFSKTAEFRQSVLVLSGNSNTSINSVTAIRANLVSSIALEAGLLIKYNSDPVTGSKTTDTITSVSLVYGF